MKADTGFKVLILVLAILLGIGGYRQYQKRSRAAATPAATPTFAYYACELHGGRDDESGYCFSCGLELAGIAAANAADSPPLKTALVLGDTEASQFPHDETALKPYTESYQAQYQGTFDADPFQRTALRAPSSGQIREWYIEAMDYVPFGKKLGTFHSPEINRAITNYNNYARYENSDYYVLNEDVQAKLREAKSRLAQLGITDLDPNKLRELALGRPVSATAEGYAINLLERNREVSSGATLLELAPRSALRVIAYFAESDLKEVTVGQTVELAFTGKSASVSEAPTSSRSSRRSSRSQPTVTVTTVPLNFSGQIASLGTVFVPARNGYEAKITSEQWPPELATGATGTVQWGTSRGTGLQVLPSSAIMETPRGPVAFKRVRAQTYRPTPVTVGQVTPGGVEIRSGLQASDRVLGDVQWLSRLGEQRGDLLAEARAAAAGE